MQIIAGKSYNSKLWTHQEKGIPDKDVFGWKNDKTNRGGRVPTRDLSLIEKI